MIIGPTPDNRVELLDQQTGRYHFVRLNQRLNLGQQCFHVLVTWLYQQLVTVLANVLTEEIEPVRHMREQRFLHRKAQPTLGHKGFNNGSYLVFQQLFRDASDDEIICVPHIIDLGLVAGFGVALPESRFKLLFQSIKGQVGQYGRDDASLRSSRPRRIQSTGFHISHFQPFP